MKRIRVLFLVGMNLSIIHLCLLRELSSLQYCTELVLVFLLTAFFLGQAAGFRLYRSWTGLRATAGFLWLTLPLPVLAGLRVWVGHLRGADLSSFFYPVMLLYLGSITALYAVLLPSVVDSEPRNENTFARAYSLELVGSLFGLIVAGLMIAHDRNPLLVIYPIGVLLIAYLHGVTRNQFVGLLVGALLAGTSFSLLDRVSMETYYQYAEGLESRPQLLFAHNSAYQRVDVLKVGHDKRLYLNGVEFFGEGELDEFNYYLSELPARLARPRSVLIVGSGSMSAVGRLESYVDRITTVELDPLVVQASREFFSDEHATNPQHHRIVFDDARHFLRHTEEKFDLIALDIPTAFTLQTGTLFTTDFFQLAKSRLSPHGVLSIYLTQPVRPNGRYEVAGPILSAAEDTFEELIALTAYDTGNSFVYAGDSLPFERSDVDSLLGRSGRFNQYLFEEDSVRRESEKWAPASLTNLSHVWAHQ